MAKTTNAWLKQFLTTRIVVEYFSVIHRETFTSLYSIYDMLYSILNIDLCFQENSSFPVHSIPGHRIPLSINDRKLHHGRFALVFETTLWSLRVPLDIHNKFGKTEVIHARNVTMPLRRRHRRMGYHDWIPSLFSTSVSGTLFCHFIFKILLQRLIWKLFNFLSWPTYTVHVSLPKCWEDICLVKYCFFFFHLKFITFPFSFHKILECICGLSYSVFQFLIHR